MCSYFRGAGLYVILPLLSSIWIFRSCVLVNFVNLRSPENAHKPNGYVIKLSNRYYLLFCFVSCTLKHLKQKCIFFPPDFNVQGYDTRATDYSNAHTHTHSPDISPREIFKWHCHCMRTFTAYTLRNFSFYVSFSYCPLTIYT